MRLSAHPSIVAGVEAEQEGQTRGAASRTRLSSLTELYPDGILGVDAHGEVTLINGQAARLLGVPLDTAVGGRVDDVLQLRGPDGVSWLDYNHPFDSINIRVGVPEQSWLNLKGEEVLTTARLVRLKPLGPVAGVAVSLRTGRGRARLDQERSDLLASVSHELRSPLSGVKGFVQVMLNRWDQLRDEQKKLMLTTVHSDADRLSRLISELLDVARLDTGRLSLAPRPSDVALLVGRAVESVQAGTSRSIESKVADGLPTAWADPDKLTQVVTNLLENAVRHGAGGVRLQVDVASDQVSEAVCITVEDDGQGIPMEMRKRVFTKFWTTGVGGSGLGLYLVNGLVRAHGGCVEIGDADSGGARISIRWPTQPSESGQR